MSSRDTVSSSTGIDKVSAPFAARVKSRPGNNDSAAIDAGTISEAQPIFLRSRFGEPVTLDSKTKGEPGTLDHFKRTSAFTTTVKPKMQASYIACGPIVFAFLRAGISDYSIELINPNKLDIVIDGEVISNQEHLHIKDIDLNSVVSIPNIVSFRAVDTSASARGRVSYKIISDQDRDSIVLKPGQQDSRYSRAKNTICFTNLLLGQDIDVSCNTDNYSLSVLRVDDDQLKLRLNQREPEILSKEFDLSQSNPRVEFEDLGLCFKLTDISQIIDGCSNISIKIDDANQPNLTEGKYPGLADEYTDFAVPIASSFGGLRTCLTAGETDDAEMMVGPFLIRLAATHDDGSYDLEIINNEKLDIFVNSDKLYRSRHLFLKGIKADSTLQLGSDVLMKQNEASVEAGVQTREFTISADEDPIVNGSSFQSKLDYHRKRNSFRYMNVPDGNLVYNALRAIIKGDIFLSPTDVKATSMKFACKPSRESVIEFDPFYLKLALDDGHHTELPDGSKIKLKSANRFFRGRNLYEIEYLPAE